MSKALKMTRRSFVRTTAGAAGAAAVAAPLFIPKTVFGANDRIRAAVLGVHGQGKGHIRSLMGLENVEVTTLCDPDMDVLNERAKSFQEQYNKKVKLVQDLRKVMDDKRIDVVTIAAPNHWHSLATIWACQAGKDVYVEKPMSHNIFEGRMAVKAARKYNRVVQHGTQQRSSASRAKEIAAVQSGKYGKLLVSKGYCCKPRWSIGYKPISTPPKALNFDVWLGPAPEQPYHGNLVHYNWHWFFDTGNGDIGNQGVHEFDVARWVIPGATLPTKVWSLGGRYGYDDQGETPNTQLAVMEFGEVKLVFEVRGLVGGESKSPRMVLNEYYTDQGMITEGKFYPKDRSAPVPLEDAGGSVFPGGPFGNFINCVRSRKTEELNAEILAGHYSSAICHLPNISYLLGDEVPFSKQPEMLIENEVVFDSFQTIRKNLAWGCGLNLQDMTFRLGRVLEFDPQTEQFVGDDEANTLLARVYRKPYTVPDTI